MTQFHGITVRDAALMCDVAESTVRSWMHRYQLPRTGDGQIDPIALVEWWDYRRDHNQAARRAKRAS